MISNGRCSCLARLKAARRFRTRIEAIERAVNQLKLPLAFADQLYVLRDHVAMVSRRLQTGFYGSA